MGASILPITYHDGQIYFLFGKERVLDENPGWSDFGGGTDAGETFMQTAVREGVEELTGFLGSKQDIKKHINKFGTYKIDYKNKGYSTYRCHLYPIDYDNKMTFYYNNNHRVIEKYLSEKIIMDSKIFEKTELRWFSFSKLKKEKHIFRSFYREIVQLLLDDEDGIRAFVNKNSKFKRSGKTRRKNKRAGKTRRKNNTSSFNI